jgi:16S rRNA processing protein RimM
VTASRNNAPRPRPRADAEIAVGRIAAPHGVKGQVRIEPLTDVPRRFAELSDVCLELPGGERRAAVIEGVSAGPSRVLLKLKGCDDRDAAGGLRGAYILIPRAQAIALPEGHYFIDDIVGLEVVTVDGDALGRVREVLRTKANDVYATDRAMIPATREVIRRIDLGAGVIVVDLPEEI